MPPHRRILVIAGPTASGKSARALEIAQKEGGVIINADAMQVYRELAVLTARPSAEEEARVPHRLYGVLPGDRPCSAGKWLHMARMEIDWALAEGKLPVVVGGTGLYLKALREGIADIPDIAPQLRAQAQNDHASMGAVAFHERLRAVDPVLAERLKPGDTQRNLRGYEVWLGTGKPLSWWQERGKIAPYPAEIFAVEQIMLPRAELYARCDARFLQMIGQGAIDEVRQLLTLHYTPDLPVMRAVGVPEIAAFLRGEASREVMIAKGQQATRNYAKRQMTWFRHQMPQDII